MKILVTGAKGFIGKNLISELKKEHQVFAYDIDSTKESLEQYCKDAEFVFHLAGVNRPQNLEEFNTGNFGFTSDLLDTLKKANNLSPVMMSSSIQAALDNPYGNSKRLGEELLFDYEKDTGAKVFIYRFQNVFGKWCRPNYNSVVATFSHNIANGLPIQMNNPDTELNLIYIDDIVKELLNALKGNATKDGRYFKVSPSYVVKLGHIAELLYSFKASRDNRLIPNMSDEFTKKLYANYLTYLPTDQFSYELKMNVDHRGSFTEFIKTQDSGQVSVNISKPGITKGNHWHHSKNEKFLVVFGQGVIRFRKIDETEIVSYYVSGDKLEVVDIPPGYTHNIENLGKTDMVTVMWANEAFDPENPDTTFVEV